MGAGGTFPNLHFLTWIMGTKHHLPPRAGVRAKPDPTIKPGHGAQSRQVLSTWKVALALLFFEFEGGKKIHFDHLFDRTKALEFDLGWK